VAGMTSAAKSPYAGYRFPGEIISHAVWLYFRFPLSLRPSLRRFGRQERAHFGSPRPPCSDHLGAG
jgi:hypothetical protein